MIFGHLMKEKKNDVKKSPESEEIKDESVINNVETTEPVLQETNSEPLPEEPLPELQ